MYFMLIKIVVGSSFRFKKGGKVWCLKVCLQCYYQDNVNVKLNIVLLDTLGIDG
jgi:hypothetical protein